MTLDARTLVAGVGEAIATECQHALVEGVKPDTREPRPRKGDGTPVGVRTRRLATGIAAGPVEGDATRARVVITVPADREAWAAAHGVLSDEGAVGEAVDRVLEAHMSATVSTLPLTLPLGPAK